MPERIRISTEYLNECCQNLKRVSQALAGCAGQVSPGISGSLASFNVSSSSPALGTRLGCIGGGMTLSQTLSAYQKALNRCSEQARELQTTVKIASDLFYNTEITLRLNAYFIEMNLMPFDGIPDFVHNSELNVASVMDKLKSLVDQTTLGDRNMPQTLKEILNLKDTVQGKILDATTATGSVGIAGTLASIAGSNKYGEGEVNIGAYNAGASYEAGLLSKDADGNLVINPHVNAEIGGSFTALSANGYQQVDIAPGVSAGVAGAVTVMKVEAVAKASVGILDADGNINPSAHLNANAQATLVDASATANVEIAGIKATGEAGVFVGVGAHADVGYENGVFKVDVGAGLGIGGNVGFSVDVGSIINATRSASKTFMTWINF